MKSLGASSFWYYNIGAFVFAGENTTVSISGRKYKIEDYIIKDNDIVTIDLSPSNKNIWGDYARTIVVENGKAVSDVNNILKEEWKNGLLFEKKLHNELVDFVDEKTTFEDVYYHMNNIILQNGYKNLDFNNNLGHSIERHKIKRIYIEKGNSKKLFKVKCFTFEPHISLADGDYGYKMENIYYFENGKLKVLS